MVPSERRKQMRTVYLTWVMSAVDTQERARAIEEVHALFAIINNAVQTLARQEPSLSWMYQARKRTYAFEKAAYEQVLARCTALETSYPWLIRPYSASDMHPIRTARLLLMSPSEEVSEQEEANHKRRWRWWKYFCKHVSSPETIRISFPVLQDALSALIVLTIEFERPDIVLEQRPGS